jgi:hypothetical protein
MNGIFERNGVIVRQSQPLASLQKVTRVLTIDSRDRDPTKFVKVNGGAAVSDPGDYVVYLPRVYERVTAIRMKSAVIQAPSTGSGWLASDLYVLVGLEGLNRIDETAAGADRSGYVDSSFAKLYNTSNISNAQSTSAIYYTDSGYDEQITKYTPPLSRLDRLHVTIRRHVPYGSVGLNIPTGAPITFTAGENSFSFEIEYLDNVFDDFSSMETRLNRS